MTVWQLDDLHVSYLLKRAPRLVLILSICQYAFLSKVQATADQFNCPPTPPLSQH